VLGVITVAWNWAGYSMNTAPVFDDTRAYVISPPNLLAIDPAQAKVVWTANGTYTGTPAVAGGLVYAISAGNLVVRDAVTGTLAWTFVGDTQLKYPPVIANGYVYVASDAHVYAAEIATHTQAFSANVGGWLSISSSRLLVAGADGTLSAFLMSK
jgi:PQQ-like domain